MRWNEVGSKVLEEIDLDLGEGGRDFAGDDEYCENFDVP